VAIATTPGGATVIVDGERKGHAPLELSLAAGTHQIVAEAGGARATRSITVEYGEPLAVTLRVVSGRGTLVVTSNVTGAMIAIDGVAVGAAPWTGPVAAGRHSVIVSAPGYTAVERAVEVPADGTAQVMGSLGRPLGYVEPPAADSPSVLLGIDAGKFEPLGVVTTIYYGYRSGSRRFEGGLGTLIGGTGIGVGFAVVTRGYLATGRVRPYVELQLVASGAAQTVHVAGGLMIAGLPLGRGGVDFFVEGGLGSGNFAGEREVFVPILAGISMHLIRTKR
jgi:hypothetical protein